MTNFDYRKFLKESKATFHSSLNEGQFSWFTQDTEEQIGSERENTLPFVYMHDDKGNKWLEKNYEGYGEFGGKDYYELLDQMNGGSGDRSEGIRLAFDDTLKGKIKFPALTVSATLPNGHDFTEEAEHDPNQSWYAGEEEEEDYGYGFGDMDREEDYDYDEEEIDEAELPALAADQVENIAQQVADKFSEKDDLDIKFTITPGSIEASPNGAGFDLDTIAGPNTPGGDWKDENGFSIDNYLGKYAGGSYYIKPEGGKHKIYNAAAQNAYIGHVTPQGEVVFEIPGFEGTMDQLNSLEEEKPKTKMKKSELKELIKSAMLAEYEKDVDYTDENPESEEDFLAEADEEEPAADAEATDVTVDDTEVTDVETTTEVDPNVKAVQDALTQAQVAAQKLGDPKLTDQIGNTITFFTRTHVVEKPKGGLAETDEMEEGKKEYYKDAEADDAEHIKALEKDMEDDKDNSMKIGEVLFPMWTKLSK